MSEETRKSLGHTEYRFVPGATSRAKLSIALLGLGAFLLGAGAHAQWLHEGAPEFASWLLLGGAVFTAIGTFLPDPDAAPLRVGPLGVAIERGGDQPERLAWCDIEKIAAEGSAIVVRGADGQRIQASLPHHAAAAAWIVAEGLDRIPKRVEVSAELREKLPSAKNAPGTAVACEPVQVAGRRCKASDKLISFEDDARLCARCGEVYHRDHVDERCATCEGSMAA